MSTPQYSRMEPVDPVEMAEAANDKAELLRIIRIMSQERMEFLRLLRLKSDRVRDAVAAQVEAERMARAYAVEALARHRSANVEAERLLAELPEDWDVEQVIGDSP